jgi:hypothetical protein
MSTNKDEMIDPTPVEHVAEYETLPGAAMPSYLKRGPMFVCLILANMTMTISLLEVGRDRVIGLSTYTDVWIPPVLLSPIRQYPEQPSIRSPGSGLLAIKATRKATIPYRDNANVWWRVKIYDRNGNTAWQQDFNTVPDLIAAPRGVEVEAVLNEFVIPRVFAPGFYKGWAELREDVCCMKRDGTLLDTSMPCAVSMISADVEVVP